MTIKKKLVLNVIVMIAGFVVIIAFSLIGMKFVQRNLSTLTEHSTPYQLKMVELQRVLQEHTSNLLKVTTSVSLSDFNTSKTEAERTIIGAERVFKELAAFKSESISTNSDIQELSHVTRDIIRITDERLKAEAGAMTANDLMNKKLQDITKNLDQLDASVKKLQRNSMDQLSTSNNTVKKITQRMKNVQTVVYAIKDFKQAIFEIVAAENKTELTVAQSRYNSFQRWITQSELAKSEKDSSTIKEVIDGITDISKYVAGTGGLIELKDSLFKNPDGETKNKLLHARSIISQKLAQMTTIVGDIDEKSSENFNAENKQLNTSLDASDIASNILAQNSELVALGYDLQRDIHETFMAKTASEIDKTVSHVRLELNQAGPLGEKLSANLATLKRPDEIKLLKAVNSSFNEIGNMMFSRDGVTEKLRNVVQVNEQVLNLNAKLKALISSQREKGKARVTAAQTEQEKSVKSVNKIVGIYTVSILLLGIVILGFGLIFSRQLSKSITSPIKKLVALAQEFGSGNFNCRMDISSKDEFGEVAGYFNTASEKITNIISDIATIINDLAMQSIVLQNYADNIAKGSDEQTRQTEQSAASMTQMTQSISEVAKTATVTSATSKETAELARKGKEAVVKSVNGMMNISSAVKDASVLAESLGASSKEIGRVIDVINEIAQQINLLALNAAIEAARAGEYGRGFAVVADEVKNLSERTVGSTHEITGIIKNIQEAVSKSIKAMKHGKEEAESGVKLVESAKSSLDRIVSASDKEAEMIQRIATASDEQSSASEQVSQSMEVIDKITKEMNNSIIEIKQTADTLYKNAENLSTAASWFRIIH